MKRRLVVASVVLASVPLAWWLFGSSTTRLGPATLRMPRLFGRVVRAEADTNGDGRVDEKYVFSWNQPMRHHQPPRMIISDRNHDGRWDLWITPLDDDDQGYARSRFDVDTDGDGRADWSFVEHDGEGARKVRARRGF
jgi:hypothetical protein